MNHRPALCRGCGGGHGDAVPHEGAHTLEVYSANTRLRQMMRVEPGAGSHAEELSLRPPVRAQATAAGQWEAFA